MIQINSRFCGGCGLCIDVCSAHAIKIQNRKAVVDNNLCRKCKQCVQICEAEAIQFISHQSFYLSPGIKVKIDSIIEEQLLVSSISPSQRLVEDLGADSLDQVELVMAFEDAFGINIPDENAQNIRTVGDIYKLAQNWCKSDAPSNNGINDNSNSGDSIKPSSNNNTTQRPDRNVNGSSSISKTKSEGMKKSSGNIKNSNNAGKKNNGNNGKYSVSPENSSVKKSFLMHVSDVYELKEQNSTVVTGRISLGRISVGDTVKVNGKSKKNIISTIAGIEMAGMTIPYAQKGDEVGLLLSNITENDIQAGSVLYSTENRRTNPQQNIASMQSDGECFSMVIYDVFDANGCCVLGIIEEGKVSVGDTVKTTGGTKKTVCAIVESIENVDLETVKCAHEGDMVGLKLSGVAIWDIQKGQILYNGESCHVAEQESESEEPLYKLSSNYSVWGNTNISIASKSK